MAVVTRITVVFFLLIIEQSLMTTSRMGRVAIFTAILGHCIEGGMGPWIWWRAVPCICCISMGTHGPSIYEVACNAEFRIGIGDPEKHTIGIVMWVVTGGTVYLVVVVEHQSWRRCRGKFRVGKAVVV